MDSRSSIFISNHWEIGVLGGAIQGRLLSSPMSHAMGDLPEPSVGWRSAAGNMQVGTCR
jgi:hypothetical protein